MLGLILSRHVCVCLVLGNGGVFTLPMRGPWTSVHGVGLGCGSPSCHMVQACVNCLPCKSHCARPVVVTAGCCPGLLSPLGWTVSHCQAALRHFLTQDSLNSLHHRPQRHAWERLPAPRWVLSCSGEGSPSCQKIPGRGQWGEGGGRRQHEPGVVSSFREHSLRLGQHGGDMPAHWAPLFHPGFRG